MVMPGDPDFSQPLGPPHLLLQRDTFEVPAFLWLLQWVYLRGKHDQEHPLQLAEQEYARRFHGSPPELNAH